MSTKVREWTLLEEVGRGGMGVVYRATHDLLSGDWAVKVIRSDLVEDVETRARFEAEIRTHFKLRHPNIVEVQSPFVEQGRMYLPMEFLDGRPLGEILKDGTNRLSPSVSLGIIKDAASAVGYAHALQSPVIHRDIKPGNIQIMSDGRVKVLDFGLARTLGEKSMTATGQAVGTPAYMAPEVLDGHAATPRSDVYSLGMVLYRMLAGRMPFDMPETDTSIHAVLLAIVRGIEAGFPDVRHFFPDIPGPLADLTMRALSRDPTRRPEDGNSFANLLGVIDAAGAAPGFDADRTRLKLDLGRDVVTDRSEGAGRDAPVGRAGGASDSSFNPDRTRIHIESIGADDSTQAPYDESEPFSASRRFSGKKIGVVAVVLALTVGMVAVVYSLKDNWTATGGQKEDGQSALERLSTQDPAGITWVRIDGGTFLMGSDDSDSFDEEKPVHTVTVSTFEMSKSEVTVAQYKKCVDASACSAPDTDGYCNWGKSDRDNHPVNCVDWDQAVSYAKFVGGRLPTEAEWEYAASSGGQNRKYPWGNQTATCDYAVMDDGGGNGCGLDRTWPVCSKPAGNTSQGLCDMSGNVYEWVQDWYHTSYNGAPSNGSAWEDSGSTRVFRGGSWFNYARYVRAADRLGSVPGVRYSILGLRVVRSVP